MKIAFVSQPIDRILSPGRNSVGIWTGEVARRLAREHEVTVFLDGNLKGGPPVVRENVTYQLLRTLPHSVDRHLNRYISRYLPVHKPYYASVYYTMMYALQAAAHLSRLNCDIIHIQNFSQYVPIIHALNPRSRIVLHMHCEWLSQLDRDMIESRIRTVDSIVGCSEYITEKIRRRFPHIAHKCKTLFNGVDESHFSPVEAGSFTMGDRTGGARLLFLGRVSPEKGVHTLVEALKEVALSHPDTRLSLVGSMHSAAASQIVKISDDEKVSHLSRFYQGSYVESLKKILGEPLLQNVEFLGRKNHDQIPAYIREADILVNPSLSESFGMALIEAMACGTPVVASQVGGMVEVIQNGRTGLLVPRDDPHALAKAILSLLDDPQKRLEIARAGQEYAVRHFSWEKIAADCSLLYQDVLAQDQPFDRPKRLIPSRRFR